jgi:hypothetical protein
MNEMIQPQYWVSIQNDPRAVARKVKHDIDTRGVAVLQDFFTPKALDLMRHTALERYEYCLGSEVRKPLIGDDLLGTIFFQIAKSDWVQAVSNPILRPFGYHVDKDDVYCAMNILHGAKSRDGIYGYHFDATLLTLAVPVIMPNPNSERRGPFRIWPNVRQFSTGWFQEKYYWRIMRVRRLRNRFPTFTVDFRPGDLYLFYGFRSWHGVDDLDETSLRVNCLINVGGPYFQKMKNKPLLPRSERCEP